MSHNGDIQLLKKFAYWQTRRALDVRASQACARQGCRSTCARVGLECDICLMRVTIVTSRDICHKVPYVWGYRLAPLRNCGVMPALALLTPH